MFVLFLLMALDETPLKTYMMIHILITVEARQYAFSEQENALFETMEVFNKVCDQAQACMGR